MDGYSHHSLDILTAHVGKDACAVTANAIVVMRASPGKNADNNILTGESSRNCRAMVGDDQ